MKPVIPGPCSGEVILVDDYVSFFGEVNPDQGCLIVQENKCFQNKVFIFRGTRGSTVAPYVIYALKKNNTAPKCILVAELEPMLIAGCVLAEIPLFLIENYKDLVNSIRNFKESVYLEVLDSELLLYGRI